MKPATLVRLALAGTRADALRVGLTAFSAVLATVTMLSAATVARLGFAGADLGSDGWAQQYSSNLLREPGLRPGVVFALGALAIPILALAAQCGRVGAPARERRLAALRLAGATPGQAVLIAAGETTVASAIGAVAGLALVLALKTGLNHPGPDGLLDWPTDVAVPLLWYVVICAGLPLVAGLIATLNMRRVTINALGVERRSRPAQPHWWPGLLIGVGIGMFATPTALRTSGFDLSDDVYFFLAVGALLASLGTVLGVGWIAQATGRLLSRSGCPSLLVAGRRLTADPWSGSRAMAAMLVALIVGSGALMIRSNFVTQGRLNEQIGVGWDTFYVDSMDLVNIVVLIAVLIATLALVVVFTERVVARRREFAALIATGTPRITLVRAQIWQSIIPAIPAVLVALAVGTALISSLGFTTVSSGGGARFECPSDPTEQACLADQSLWVEVAIPEMTRQTPIPFADLALLGGGALALLLVVAGLSLTVLRSSTDISELRTA